MFFQNRMTIGIGKSEINKFQVLAIMSEHDVRWLQVTMLCLAAMHIGYCFQKHVGYMATLFLRVTIFFQPLFQRLPFYPLHHDTKPQALNFFKRKN